MQWTSEAGSYAWARKVGTVPVSQFRLGCAVRRPAELNTLALPNVGQALPRQLPLNAYACESLASLTCCNAVCNCIVHRAVKAS